MICANCKSGDGPVCKECGVPWCADATGLAVVDRAALEKVLEGFDKHVFIRNTDGDGASDWAVKLLPFVNALGKLVRSVGESKP